MTADFPMVLDACILVQAPLRDTLLRLAEHPRLYLPRWSDQIIAETVRTLENRIGLSAQKTAYLAGQLREHFGDTWRPKVRRPGDLYLQPAGLPPSATSPWEVEVQGPSRFLRYKYDRKPR